VRVFQGEERATVVKIIESVKDWKKVCIELQKDNKTIGFVPTMGALHRGHMSLIKASVAENDITICSIFVNPTQFNDPNDLKNYPITLDSDRELLDKEGCSYIFLPNRDMIYPDNYRYIVSENNYSKLFCGAHRTGHFDGVLTVVLKLLNIIEANRAYFGEKDWQQLNLIKDMAKAFFLKTEILSCPIVREEDGLAFSSRNTLLKKEEREIAPNLYRILTSGIDLKSMDKELNEMGFKVDYIERDGDRILAAAYLGEVRLIDNVKG
jgi:pantoate--beta-alanine ligase